MPLPVIGSVSEPEAVGLGKLFESQARKQTGTLFNGIDFITEADGSCFGQFKSIFVHRTGASAASCAKLATGWLRLFQSIGTSLLNDCITVC